ncbi:YggS family pyridoxal phosphate-dependent enzyme [Rubricoccus marinus]|uniref:Pyridoxal phosphate homeostasis protein n=1 Tax=Rubricoccus marinus TaxID=716817 RepID=A0A259TZ43_9BACT|nr:YggS family pyridoxal phosphate-dependent enzyme [Rubricoccus marinus]OZC03045.1 YggS family pyridoxal phosphate enzyme [Rubricoccus marinus]
MSDPHTLSDRLAFIRDRIGDACARAGRDPSEVTLIAVTKTHGLDVLRDALGAGLTDLGENRVGELVEKADALADASGGAPTWHFIGSLQRNKARDVAERADLFHALDSPRLAKELNKRASGAGRVLRCLVQVNISGEDSKHGVAPEALPELLERAQAFESLNVCGLMGMAEPAAPEDLDRIVRPQFARLRHLAETGLWREAPLLSMGMSGDFETAIEEGATHVRLGRVLFGARG